MSSEVPRKPSHISASQPSRFAPSPTQSRPGNELVFEPLLDSDEAAQLLRIHPKTLQRMARNRDSAVFACAPTVTLK